MGVTEIRTAMKVDLQRPASEQSGLHVSLFRVILEISADGHSRIDGIPIVGYVISYFLTLDI